MIFWAYNPLAGGLLTGKYAFNHDNNNSRFKDNKIYQNIFWKPEIINELSDFFTMPLSLEYSLKWLLIYSKLRQNDKIILGVSTIEQLDNNINIINNGNEFDIQTIEYLNNLYNRIEEYSPNYFY
jgi:aflatoxin B1 aldehyde reductase